MKLVVLGLIISGLSLGIARVDVSIEGKSQQSVFVDTYNVKNYKVVSDLVFNGMQIQNSFNEKMHAYTSIDNFSMSKKSISSNVIRLYGWCFNINGIAGNDTIENTKIMDGSHTKLEWYKCFSEEFIFFSPKIKRVSDELNESLDSVTNEAREFLNQN